MKKVMLVIMLFLLITLSSCVGEKLDLHFDSNIDTPNNYVIGYGTETHFEMGFVMPEAYVIHKDGVTFYQFFGAYYIPQEDGTYDIVYRTGSAYNSKIEFSFTDYTADQFYPLLDGKKFKKSIISSRYKYSNDEYKIVIQNENKSSLSFDVIYVDQEMKFNIETIDSDEHDVLNYELVDTPKYLLDINHTFEKVEGDTNEYALKHVKGDVIFDFENGWAYFSLNATEYKYDLDAEVFLTVSVSQPTTKDLVNDYYGELIVRYAQNIYDRYEIYIKGIVKEGY